MAVSNHPRSIPDIFTTVVNQFTILVRKEAQLARTEMSEKINDLAVGIGLLVGGAALLIPALVILLQAAVTALVDAKVAMVWATLIVGGGALAIGVTLLTREIRENPIPVLLITIGIGWLAIAASRSPRATLGVDRKLKTAPLDEIGADVVTRVEASPEECSLGLSAVDA
jgi:hypothetical protein